MKTFTKTKAAHYQLLPYSIIVMIYFLTGCGVVQTNKQILSSDTQEPIQMIQSKNTLYWGSTNMKLPNNMQHEEHMKIRQTYYKNLHRYDWRIAKMEKISSAKSWQEAHAEAKDMIESTRNDILNFEIAQETASSMLRSFFIQLEPTPEVQEAIEYYLNVLIKYGYYREPNLYAQVLPKLQSRWTKEHIKEVAIKVIYENTFFFKEKFSPDNQYLLKVQQQTKKQSASQISTADASYWVLKTPVTQEEMSEASQIKVKFRNNLDQVIKDQQKKLNHKDWGEWVFSYIDSLLVLDCLCN